MAATAAETIATVTQGATAAAVDVVAPPRRPATQTMMMLRAVAALVMLGTLGVLCWRLWRAGGRSMCARAAGVSIAVCTAAAASGLVPLPVAVEASAVLTVTLSGAGCATAALRWCGPAEPSRPELARYVGGAHAALFLTNQLPRVLWREDYSAAIAVAFVALVRRRLVSDCARLLPPRPGEEVAETQAQAQAEVVLGEADTDAMERTRDGAGGAVAAETLPVA